MNTSEVLSLVYVFSSSPVVTLFKPAGAVTATTICTAPGVLFDITAETVGSAYTGSTVFSQEDKVRTASESTDIAAINKLVLNFLIC